MKFLHCSNAGHSALGNVNPCRIPSFWTCYSAVPQRSPHLASLKNILLSMHSQKKFHWEDRFLIFEVASSINSAIVSHSILEKMYHYFFMDSIIRCCTFIDLSILICDSQLSFIFNRMDDSLAILYCKIMHDDDIFMLFYTITLPHENWNTISDSPFIFPGMPDFLWICLTSDDSLTPLPTELFSK